MVSSFRYAINPTQYYGTNYEIPFNISVGVQTVHSVTCMYGCASDALGQNLHTICGFVGASRTSQVMLTSLSAELMLPNQTNSSFKV